MMKNKRYPKSAEDPKTIQTLEKNYGFQKLFRGIVEIENSELAALIFVSDIMEKFLNDNPTLNAYIKDCVSVRTLKNHYYLKKYFKNNFS